MAHPLPPQSRMSSANDTLGKHGVGTKRRSVVSEQVLAGGREPIPGTTIMSKERGCGPWSRVFCD